MAACALNHAECGAFRKRGGKREARQKKKKKSAHLPLQLCRRGRKWGSSEARRWFFCFCRGGATSRTLLRSLAGLVFCVTHVRAWPLVAGCRSIRASRPIECCAGVYASGPLRSAFPLWFCKCCVRRPGHGVICKALSLHRSRRRREHDCPWWIWCLRCRLIRPPSLSLRGPSVVVRRNADRPGAVCVSLSGRQVSPRFEKCVCSRRFHSVTAARTVFSLAYCVFRLPRQFCAA